ncbi:MAG: type IIA DNA topoisomerase subunit B [Bacteroides sp.]|nr:type IIA DNA topoisomerase subunit B [Bacteroides sp.]MBD5271216.1 type IIA DNA topoisomerase subunit B [Bacteroides sp.]MBD5332147.1 type IIA DNA topoisomerase subunit B [Bacteroides sp.]
MSNQENNLQSDPEQLFENGETETSAEVQVVDYSEDDIRTLDWKEHLRRRPGMYIGKLGDGSNFDDGIYVLIKEVLDNGIDEFMMGYGKQILVDVEDSTVTVRDFGRGIPLGKVVDVSSKMNTGAKYDSKSFKKSVGLNGVGIKAVNALSSSFYIRSIRDGRAKAVSYSRGEIVEDYPLESTDEPTGTLVKFTPDSTVFRDYQFQEKFIVPLIKNYTYLNTGLKIVFNGNAYVSRGGLLDLLRDNMSVEPLYEPIHLKGEDIEVTITHANQRGEEYYSFVNGQHTTQGGTHLSAFKEAVSRTIKEHFKSDFDYSDIRNGMIAAVSVKVEEPVFESQTKTKLGSRDVGPEGPSVAKFVGDFIKTELDNYLHRNLETAEILLRKIKDSERERKAMAGVAKLAREKAKKVNLHNKKLLDCRVHFNDPKGDEEKKLASSIFITEGDSAAGSITKIRNVETQAVFSLRGKPKNSYGVPAKILYENDEFNLLQAALNIEEGIDGLRYNNVIIATDADVDGMHIRLLLMTFFLQFFPDMVKKGHLYVLQTPLFRVRNGKTARRGRHSSGPAEETYYCYTDQERIDAINKLGDNAEITRFKGLGEISPEEFRGFIGPDMRVDRVALRKEDAVDELLEFYMGKNTMDRQEFIINNLRVEDDSHLNSLEHQPE